MTYREHLLVKLMEECAEVSQRASKSMNFGDNEKEPGQDLKNCERLRLEVNDLLTVIAMIDGTKSLPSNRKGEAATHTENKIAKIYKFRKYSEKLGMVTK
jgi:hypothetical protein